MEDSRRAQSRCSAGKPLSEVGVHVHVGASAAVLRTEHDPAVSAAASRVLLAVLAASGKWREDRALDGCAYCILCLA